MDTEIVSRLFDGRERKGKILKKDPELSSEGTVNQ
jgi:hypothetical protein